MSGPADRRDRDPREARLLFILRLVVGIVLLVLFAFLVVVDSFGRLLVNPSFHTDSIVLGAVLGALLLVIGVVGAAVLKLPGGWEVRREDDDPKKKGT